MLSNMDINGVQIILRGFNVPIEMFHLSSNSQHHLLKSYKKLPVLMYINALFLGIGKFMALVRYSYGLFQVLQFSQPKNVLDH